MNDDTLILYYYDDGLTEAERLEVRAALRRDAALRERYERLCADLCGVAAEPVAVPAGLEARWHASIERAANRGLPRADRHTRAFHLPSFAWGTAVAAALVLGLAVGLYVSGDGPPEPPHGVVDAGADAAPAVAFARGFKVHLRESRRQLADLPAAASRERALLVERMIEQNRLFERAASRNGAQDLARVLRAFEPILERLAADDVTAAEAAALEAKLAFELNVMLTKLTRRVSEETGPI